jgi:hypothetical protein
VKKCQLEEWFARVWYLMSMSAGCESRFAGGHDLRGGEKEAYGYAYEVGCADDNVLGGGYFVSWRNLCCEDVDGYGEEQDAADYM